MIVMFLAPGFEEVEALAPLDLLRRAGLEVVTVAVREAKTNQLIDKLGRLGVYHYSSHTLSLKKFMLLDFSKLFSIYLQFFLSLH